MAAIAENPAPGADELFERHEAARVVAGMVSALREPQRALILMRYAEGIEPIEIARRRGLPEGTVRRQLKEALDELRMRVAAHYESQRRNWHLVLAPLAGAAPRRPRPTWKGAFWMTVKSKIGFGVAVAVVLMLVLVLGRATTPHTTTLAENAARRDRQDVVRASGTARANGGTGPMWSPGGAVAPPSFAKAATIDPAGCEEKLAQLRAAAGAQANVSREAFEAAKPSPTTEREIAPVVERVMSSLPGRPTYQLECRVSVCRVGMAMEREAKGEAPIWLQALERDPALVALRGDSRGVLFESRPTRDALTAAPMVQHWAYFNMPIAGAEEHPVEVRAGAVTCGERVEALQQSLHREQSGREGEAIRPRRFESLPTNPELARRVAAAFSPLLAMDGGAAGAWDCRGSSECRWRGSRRALQLLDPRRVNDALAAQGISGRNIRLNAHVEPRKGADHDAGALYDDAELTLRPEGGRAAGPPTGVDP
jgi:hypothetical protein